MTTTRKLGTRGRTFVGTVTKAKAQKTATVEWERRRPIPKYERYEKRRSRVQAHNPESINAQHGDRVRIAECRPISKTKRFVIVEKLGTDVEMLEKEQRREEIHKKEEPEEEQ